MSSPSKCRNARSVVRGRPDRTRRADGREARGEAAAAACPTPFAPPLYVLVASGAGTLAVILIISVAVAGYVIARRPAQAVAETPSPAVLEIQETVPAPVSELPSPELVLDPPNDLPEADRVKAQQIIQPPPVPKTIKKAELPKPEPARDAPLPVVNTFKRRDRASADDLSKQLLLVPEIGLDQATAARLLATKPTPHSRLPQTTPEAFLKNTELSGLPVRMGLECHLGKEAAETMQVLSRQLRTYLTEAVPKDGIDSRPDPVALRKFMQAGSPKAPIAQPAPGAGQQGDGTVRTEWRQPEAIPALVQLLQAENKPLRILLVELLTDIKGEAGTTALAQRALFDLSDEVREAAVTALKDRPRDDVRDQLFKGLRYPWGPVADHAAEALVALKDGDALGGLVDLLDKPDPSAAYVRGTKAQTTVVREVVRVNHLNNCALCHAPSFDKEELVRGLVPDPTKPLPPSFSPAYYHAATGTFVRADITYLKQDFAVPQPVTKHGVWPANQRNDYLVRTRPATDAEIAAAKQKKAGATYPQREAALFALRELTGKDAGKSSDEWRLVVKGVLTKLAAEEDR